MLPESAYAQTADAISPMPGLWEFHLPGYTEPGLRVYLTPHKNAADRLAASGFVQTGDIILTFRPEWGFKGPYPNIQMGISHTGLAFVENGVMTNVDSPLTDEYLGAISSKHYKEASALHIIRPRNLSARQKENLAGWMIRLSSHAAEIYPSHLWFNKDYTSPKYTAGLGFVKTLAQIALRQDPTAAVDLYCSEFAWALLSLRNCDPAQPEVFAREGTPACINPIFIPLPMIGSYFLNPQPASPRLGLADGPLAVINSMTGLTEDQKKVLLGTVFESKEGTAPMSPGHAAAAEAFSPYYLRLKDYYSGIQEGAPEALQIMNTFNNAIKPNYSPTSYLINTLLPEDSAERRMDVVGTVLFTD
jgi:hypothetical protein